MTKQGSTEMKADVNYCFMLL